MKMKGTVSDACHSVKVVEGSAAFQDVIDNHIYEQTLTQKSAFFVADLGVVLWQHVRWRTHMDWIRPFYPVKSNSSPVIIELLAALGTGFICASKRELELVRGLGVSSKDIILSSLCKQLSQIKYAAKNGIDLLVCDNEVELRKIARSHPGAKLLLQVAVMTGCQEEEETAMSLGCSLKDCRHLLECAKELSLQVSGVKFQIPRHCQDPEVYTHAVSDARCVFDMGEELGFQMHILDIGGGFGDTEDMLQKAKRAVKPILDVYFPPSTGVSVIAEPGAYYVSAAFTLAVNIITKKMVARDCSNDSQDRVSADDEPEFQYYMNDGVYGSFAYKLLEDSIPAPSVHKVVSAEEPLFSSSLWGPSSDGLDRVVEHCLLPELSVGDWLLFSNAGANSLGTLSCHGEEHIPHIYYTISAGDWYEIQNSGIILDTTMKSISLVHCLPSTLPKDSVSSPA
ncbi:antizyme inhibitor 1a isoform X1 [Chanos chanos]|uniref:Antizyme inhibitor 1a isoform X1 n=1 Tax=Chanos chanos TaxID=29144 RepID=A0A6J2W1M4_CHACN|nr:antizyme inhibitor 1-like isoform X1 [Chanos chanos]